MRVELDVAARVDGSQVRTARSFRSPARLDTQNALRRERGLASRTTQVQTSNDHGEAYLLTCFQNSSIPTSPSLVVASTWPGWACLSYQP